MAEKYPYSLLERKVNGKDVTILGVVHDAENFEKYKDFFKEQVSANDALVMEQPAPMLSDFSMESSFLGPFSEFARAQQKKIYVADPISTYSYKLYQSRLRKGLNLSIAAVTAVLMSKALKNYWAGVIIGNLCLLGALWESRDYHDYRDIKIAKGIGKICKEKNEKKILAVHGDWHSKGIDFYLSHPSMAKAKLSIYPDYEKTAKNCGLADIREYLPISDEEASEKYSKDAENCIDVILMMSPKNYRWIEAREAEVINKI